MYRQPVEKNETKRTRQVAYHVDWQAILSDQLAVDRNDIVIVIPPERSRGTS